MNHMSYLEKENDMKKFRVTGWETVRFTYIVEAESLEEAEDWNYFVLPDQEYDAEERLDGEIDTVEEVK